MNFGGISIGHGILAGHVIFLFGGLFLLLIGLALLYTLFYWRTRAVSLEAEIIGVRQVGASFYSVYRFVMPDGQNHEATSGKSSGRLQGRETGLRTHIRVLPDRPDEILESESATIWALALGFTAGGLWITWLALTSWPATFLAWIVTAGLAIYLTSHMSRFVKSKQGLLARARAQSENKWEFTPIRQAQELTAPARGLTITSKGRHSGPIFCVAAMGIIGTAYIPAHQLLSLRTGAHANGVVTSLEANNANNSDPNVFPTVGFTASDGSIIHFRDRTGSNPAPYKVGDRVAVIYKTENPQSTAMIDRGIRNWVPVGMLLLLGGTFGALGLFSLRKG